MGAGRYSGSIPPSGDYGETGVATNRYATGSTMTADGGGSIAA